MNLQPGDHKVRLVVKGEKRPESEGTRVYITVSNNLQNSTKEK